MEKDFWVSYNYVRRTPIEITYNLNETVTFDWIKICTCNLVSQMYIATQLKNPSIDVKFYDTGDDTKGLKDGRQRWR